MKTLLYFILFLIFISADAQNAYVVKTPEIDTVFSTKLTGDFFIERKQYIGSQYFNAGWYYGDILLATGETVSNKMLKYNGLLDELMWLNSLNFGVFKIDKSSLSDFWLKNPKGGNHHFKKIDLFDSNKDSITSTFAELIVEGALSLYVHRKIEMQFPRFTIVNNIRQKYDVLEPKPVYYIQLHSNKTILLENLKRKTVLNLFPERHKEISKYINDNKLIIKKESDFVKLISLLNNDEYFRAPSLP